MSTIVGIMTLYDAHFLSLSFSQDIFPLSVEVTGPREVRKGMPWKVATRSSLTKNSSAIFPNTFNKHRKQVEYIHLKIVRASRDCCSVKYE